MRVGFLANHFPKVSETFVIASIGAAINAGHEVAVFARRTGDPDVMQQAGVSELGLLDKTLYLNAPSRKVDRLCRVPSLFWQARYRVPVLRALNVRRYGRQAMSLNLAYAAAGVLSAPPVDVLHAQFGTLVPLLVTLRRLGAIPESTGLIVSIRGADISRYLRQDPQMYDEAFGIVDRWLSVSRYFAERLVSVGAPRERVQVIHSGIDVLSIPFTSPHRTTDGVPHLVMVGRLVEKKGFGTALEALARVAVEGLEFRVTVVGDGPLRSQLERRTQILGLAPRVSFVGPRHREEVLSLLATGDVFAAPSLTAEDGDEEGIRRR